MSTASHAQREGLYYIPFELEQDPYDELTFFSCGTNFLSNNVYLGRKDSAVLPYLTPFIGYQLFNSMYIKASASYVPLNKVGHFDVFTLAAGYDRNFGKKVQMGIDIEKYFYQRNSPSIRASIKESLDFYCLYKAELIEPQLLFTYNHGSATDFVAGLSLDHNFRFKQNTINLIPAVVFNMGSENYYNDYFVNRLMKKDQNLLLTHVVKNAEQVKPLDIEGSVKATYRTAQWFFTFSGTWAIPLSAATIQLPTKTVKEKLTGSMFAELDICYRHERK